MTTHIKLVLETNKHLYIRGSWYQNELYYKPSNYYYDQVLGYALGDLTVLINRSKIIPIVSIYDLRIV